MLVSAPRTDVSVNVEYFSAFEMSLVAYGSSDEDSENEENEQTANAINANNTDDDTTTTVAVQINSKLSLPAPKALSHSTNDEKEEEESDDTERLKCSLDTLPQPVDLHSVVNVIEEDDDIPLKRETEHEAAKPVKKQTVKITVPSLSEFQDLEEESEKKPVRVVQSLEKGCGLFALLMPPSTKTVNDKTLIPQAIKNATVKANIGQSKTAKKPDPSQQNHVKGKKSIVDKLGELDSDEDDADIDFFGLTASKNVTDNSASRLQSTELLPDALTINNMEAHSIHNSPSTSSNILIIGQSSHSNKMLTSNIMNLSKNEILLKNKAEVGPKLPVPEQEYNVDTEGNVAFDEKAIEYLCGKRGVKRKDKEIDEANIIEINGEDIKPNEREWLVKALTEEPVHRPASMQSCGINSQSKKKHQITYLAHQAKAMELELQNQWSQNKMTRKQTKSKYGF